MHNRDKTPAMEQIEENHGQPIERLIVELYDVYGNHESVARELGVSRATLQTWKGILRIRSSLRASTSDSDFCPECGTPRERAPMDATS